MLNSDPNPLAQIVNLRSQAEKASKTQNLYEQRVGGWLEWSDVQKARVTAIGKLNLASTHAERVFAHRDAAAMGLLSLIPPDRVGCIRKLRLGHTLKRKEGDAGGWKMDLSKQRDGHKTSRFYGPFAASLPTELTPILDQYAALLEYEVDGDVAYLFHPPNGSNDRPMESSAWTSWVRRLFKRHHGEEVAPKTLRSVFITWLRDSTSAPEVLKSAAVSLEYSDSTSFTSSSDQPAIESRSRQHAMKHSEKRQQGSEYDQEADDRLVKAAYTFNLDFCAQFTAEVPEPPAAGSSRALRSSGAAASSSTSPSVVVSALASVTHLLKCNHDDCMALPTESLLVCGCAKVYHRSCAIEAGCTENNPLCALCLSCQPPGQGGTVNLAASRIRADPPPPPPGDAPPAANPPPRRCVFAACQSDTPSEGLRECTCGYGPHHHFCSIAAGCEDDPSLCARCLNVPIFEPAIDHPAPPAEGDGGVGGDEGGAAGGVALDDAAINARLAALHCEWVDEEMQTELRGTVETEPIAVRGLLDQMGVDSCSLFIFPEGKRWDFKRSEYSGKLHLTSQMVDEWQPLEGGPWVARLMRPSRQPVPHATYRNFYVAIGIDEDTPLIPCGQVKFPIVPGAPTEGIICNLPSQWGSRVKQLVFPLKLSKNGCSANEVTINVVEYCAPDIERAGSDGDSDHLVESDGESDDGHPLRPPPSFAPLAAAQSPYNAVDDPSSVDESPDALDRRRALDVLDAGTPSKVEFAGLVGQPAQAAANVDDDAVSMAAHESPLGADQAAETEEEEEPPAIDEQQDAQAAGAADVEVEEQVEEVEAQQGQQGQLQEPPSPPLQQQPEPPQPWRSSRKRKAKTVFGDNGELDGPASSFRSAPAARKASISLAEETGVPAFAMPGATVWAMGLHCGVRKRFRAKVVSLRRLFPRIVVKYIATESGGTHPLELPDPITAYLTMTDLEPNTLILP